MYNAPMKRLLLLSLLALAACNVKNPDPNHTHADFAVYVGEEKLDFSADELMSGVSTDDTTHDEAGEYLHQYLHLHDNNGNVIHSHKPGQTLQEFFDSLQVGFSSDCYASFMPMADGEICDADHPFRLFVNGLEVKPFDLNYAFKDLDQILITTAATDEKVQEQLNELTDEACKYSKTCPWRGAPPTENCVADPNVPCSVPLEDL